jgi:preprotein translocase subunit SecE
LSRPAGRRDGPFWRAQKSPIWHESFGFTGLEIPCVRSYVPVLSARRANPGVRVPIWHERLMAERFNPFTFLQQVRAEAAKIVWPSQRETMISTVMVVVMAFLAAIMFLIADQVISLGVKWLLGLGSGT